MACDYGAILGISPNCLPPNDHVGGNVDVVGILSGYSAGVGYDQATGLGSLNVANVVNSFEGIGNHPATLTVTPASYNITANQTLNVTISVAAALPADPRRPER